VVQGIRQVAHNRRLHRAVAGIVRIGYQSINTLTGQIFAILERWFGMADVVSSPRRWINQYKPRRGVGGNME
jgi:hypothetical protein